MGDTVIPLAIVVTKLGARGLERRILTARDDVTLAAAMLASCFIPGPYSHMVCIDRRPTFDGAWLGRVPVDALAQLGCRRVIACVSDEGGRLLRGAVWTRHMIPPPGLDCRVLFPFAPLPLRTFDFDRVATLETFAIGRESASLFARKNGPWLLGAR